MLDSFPDLQLARSQVTCTVRASYGRGSGVEVRVSHLLRSLEESDDLTAVSTQVSPVPDSNTTGS